MLGGNCSPCCTPPASFVGAAFNGWGPTFHGWNMLGKTLLITQAQSQYGISSEDFYKDNSWTLLFSGAGAVRNNPYNVAGPYPLYDAGPNGFPWANTSHLGPRSGKIEVRFLPSSVQLRATLQQRAGKRNSLGVIDQAESNVVLQYEKSRAGFWEEKLSSGVFVFTSSDLVNFTATSDALPVSQSHVGSIAIVQRPSQANGQPSWSSVLDLPLRFRITETSSEFPYLTLPSFACTHLSGSDRNNTLFFTVADTPVDWSQTGTICQNENTTSNVYCLLATFDNTPEFYGLTFYGKIGPATQRSQFNCGGFLNRASCGFTSDNGVEFAFQVNQIHWEAFSNSGQLSVDCTRNASMFSFPGVSFLTAQSLDNATGCTITINKL